MESQRSIADWRQSVFGKSDEPAAVLCRALVEFGELMELLVDDEASAALREAIQQCVFDVGWTDDPIAIDAGEVADEMADVMIVLFGAADDWGIDLMKAVDRKMQINRRRTWDITGPGLGQHVE